MTVRCEDAGETGTDSLVVLDDQHLRRDAQAVHERIAHIRTVTLRAGGSTPAVQRILSVSYVAHLLAKPGARDRIDLVILARRGGLIALFSVVSPRRR
ncbi:hypothetical protein [Actinoplanes sp. NPDC051411]|uniref:hypothetical protein n=1 Tax=Actinoplanes sp. NPDC051411 TaxID=3155522 RepID=UPI0034362923